EGLAVPSPLAIFDALHCERVLQNVHSLRPGEDAAVRPSLGWGRARCVDAKGVAVICVVGDRRLGRLTRRVHDVLGLSGVLAGVAAGFLYCPSLVGVRLRATSFRLADLRFAGLGFGTFRSPDGALGFGVADFAVRLSVTGLRLVSLRQASLP